MTLRDLLAIAGSNLWRLKLRTFLTIAGVVIAIAAFVAMLSYSTGESGKGKDVDEMREATRIAKERSPDLKIEGPIQYDAAVDASVARTKLPDSEVAGRATVFIVPDLNTGNNLYKAVQTPEPFTLAA